MTKPYSLAFKEKMLERLTGKDAVSAIQLGREVGVPQQTDPCAAGRAGQDQVRGVAPAS
jgi:hypothetical protein